ncbi:phospholipase D-like domain-containing protein [Peptostreptococcus anaerobius]
MNTDKLQSLKASMEVSFVDSHAICSEKYNSQYKSDLIYNDYKTGSKVLCSIIDELNECDEFLFSVAFITMSGITPLLQVLKDLENRGVKGKIITTDYLDFSEPRALEKLSEFKNIELKIYCSHDSNIGFHTKGYIFKNDQMYRIIVGSANMTQNAMTKNKEWNSSIKSNIDGQYTQTVLSEFYSLWNDENSFACDQVIEKYRLKYNLIKKQKKIAREKEIPSLSDYKLYPNSMQLDFINNIKELVL